MQSSTQRSNYRFLVFGLGTIILYCVVSAFARVFANNILQHYDPFEFCLYTFTWGAIIFAASNIRCWHLVRKKLHGKIVNVFWLNVTTMGSWLFLTYPLKFIEPAIVSSLTFGIGPIACLLLGEKFYQKSEDPFYDYLISGGLFGIIIYIMYLCLTRITSMPNTSLGNIIFSLLCCVTVGISIVINSFQTKKLIQSQFGPLDILMLRFFFLIILAYFLTINHIRIGVIWGRFFDPDILYATLLFVVLPLFLIQIAQRELEPISVAVIMPFLPIFTYFFELSDGRFNTNVNTFLSIAGMLILVLMGIALRYRKETGEKTVQVAL